jgi:hypothetical protein
MVVIIDGIDHMKLVPDSEKEMEGEAVAERDRDSSDDENPVDVPKPKKVEEEQPKIYNCPICTFENPLSVPNCDMCGSERPPMEQILADFRQANMPHDEAIPNSSREA